MSSSIINSSVPAQVSSSGNIFKGQCRLEGIFVSSASGGPTITVYDDAAAGTGTLMVAQFTPAAATRYKLPFIAGAGLNIVIGGTVACVVGYMPGG